MAFLGSANYSPDGTTFTWQSGRKSHVHIAPPSSSFKSNYKLQCHICDETINRGDWATRVSEHQLTNPDRCQPGVTLRGEAFKPSHCQTDHFGGTCQMSKFTGCRIVHRDCCCSSATHGDSVFTLMQWDDIFENEDNGTPFPPERWPDEADDHDHPPLGWTSYEDSDGWNTDGDEEMYYQCLGKDGRTKFVCDVSDESFDVIDWNRAYAARWESDLNFDRLYGGGGNGWDPVYDPIDPSDIYFCRENRLRCNLAKELRTLMGGHGGRHRELRAYTHNYPDSCSWALCLFIAAQP
jgi:hypothetical protein